MFHVFFFFIVFYELFHFSFSFSFSSLFQSVDVSVLLHFLYLIILCVFLSFIQHWSSATRNFISSFLRTKSRLKQNKETSKHRTRIGDCRILSFLWSPSRRKQNRWISTPVDSSVLFLGEYPTVEAIVLYRNQMASFPLTTQPTLQRWISLDRSSLNVQTLFIEFLNCNEFNKFFEVF